MSAERLVAIRGATTVEADAREAVMERTGELLRALLDRNGVDHDDLVSIIFTATEDVVSEFPAAAARSSAPGCWGPRSAWRRAPPASRRSPASTPTAASCAWRCGARRSPTAP